MPGKQCFRQAPEAAHSNSRIPQIDWERVSDHRARQCVHLEFLRHCCIRDSDRDGDFTIRTNRQKFAAVILRFSLSLSEADLTTFSVRNFIRNDIMIPRYHLYFYARKLFRSTYFCRQK